MTRRTLLFVPVICAALLGSDVLGLAQSSEPVDLDAITRIKEEGIERSQVMDIVKMKMKDLNATSEEAAFRVISGTARSMGIEVV